MKTRNILLLVLALGMIQDQTLVASKHYLIETKDNHNIETKDKKIEGGKDYTIQTKDKKIEGGKGE